MVHKFYAQRVKSEHGNFDSTAEYRRYLDLLALEKAGKIAGLRRQVPYDLPVVLRYKADFVYTDLTTGREVVEDKKGFKTREYERKKRLMKKIHNIEIYET